MDLQKIAKNIRITILKAITASKTSHIGSAFSMVDILTILYFKFITDDDKIIISKWHAGSGLYATLAEKGYFDKNELIDIYCRNGSKFGGHITYGSNPAVHASAGSLGHGLPIGCGMALAKNRGKVYVITGDGEINEWSNWESVMFASHHHLSSLIWIIDRNGQQSFGKTKTTLDIPELPAILSAFGWNVQEIDGHNFDELDIAFSSLSDTKPNVIIANTIKWKWVSFMEDKVEFHYRPPTSEQLELALRELS